VPGLSVDPGAETLHVTFLFELPATVALNCTDPPMTAAGDDGEIVTLAGVVYVAVTVAFANMATVQL
jgi:hypothetical protein